MLEIRGTMQRLFAPIPDLVWPVVPVADYVDDRCLRVLQRRLKTSILVSMEKSPTDFLRQKMSGKFWLGISILRKVVLSRFFLFMLHRENSSGLAVGRRSR
jgi:hypothetical protein